MCTYVQLQEGEDNLSSSWDPSTGGCGTATVPGNHRLIQPLSAKRGGNREHSLWSDPAGTEPIIFAWVRFQGLVHNWASPGPHSGILKAAVAPSQSFVVVCVVTNFMTKKLEREFWGTFKLPVDHLIEISSKEPMNWLVVFVLQARIAFLQGERKGQENLKNDLVRRIKMLEYALKQERWVCSWSHLHSRLV